MNAATAAPHETVGHVFPVWTTAVTRVRQARYHAAAGVNDALFSRFADPHVLANDCLKGARSPEALGRTRLHAGVRLKQHDRLLPDEPLAVHAEVVALERQRRGEMIAIAFSFRRPDGSAPVVIEHWSLMLDEVAPSDAAARSAPEMEPQGFAAVATHALTPAMVSGYSAEFPYLEGHHDAAAAQRIGMRTGIAQGLMMFGYAMAEIFRAGPPRRLDVEARFVRPVFWDETVSVEARRDGGRLAALRVVKPDRKVATTATVHLLETD